MENKLNKLHENNIHIRYMELSDVDAVYALEMKCFTTPWSRESFVQELTTNKLAKYMVLELDGTIVAYGGLWLIVDEAHITNIAVDPDRRRLGLGKKLVQGMIDEVIKMNMTDVTLEVRDSNLAARELYAGFGFKDAGRRPNYYQEPKEDAIIMWLKL